MADLSGYAGLAFAAATLIGRRGIGRVLATIQRGRSVYGCRNAVPHPINLAVKSGLGSVRNQQETIGYNRKRVVLERAKIADEARQLKRDKATFSTLVTEAERIEGAGANALDRDARSGSLTGAGLSSR